MNRYRKKPAPRPPPANATAWCVLHERLMNDLYIRRRGCLMRMCKHFRWLCMAEPPFNPGRWGEPCGGCEDEEDQEE